MLTVLEFVARDGSSPFGKWFAELDAAAAAKVTTAVRIDFGTGYRIYFGKDGDVLVILLGGGKKKSQQHDIATAHARWKDYKQRKPKEK